MDNITVNLTLKLHKTEVSSFENWIRHNADVISFKHLPETSNMYKNNTHFKKMVDSIKKQQKERDIYINDNNYKYKDDI